MIKKLSVWLLLMCLLFVLQSSFLPRISVQGVSPDLLVAFVVSFSFLYGNRHGVWMGFIAGLLQDLSTGTFFGVHTFCGMLIGYACGSFSKKVFKEQLLLPVAAVAASSAAKFFLIAALVYMMGYRFDIAEQAGKAFIPMLIMNTVPSVPVHWLTRKTDEFLKEKK